jgi:hypothetical protein
MTQDDERGTTPARPGAADAPTQALPQTAAGRSGQGLGSTFERPAGARPTPQHSRSAAETAVGAGSPGLGVSGAERRPVVPRPSVGRSEPRGGGRPPVRTRRAKLALRRVDPWSVFVFSLLASIFLGIVLVVAVAVLYSVLANLGVLDSVNDLFGEVAGDGTDAGAPDELITSSRVLTGAAVLAAVDIVLLTALATLGALLYNLCAALTGGIEVTLGERD